MLDHVEMLHLGFSKIDREIYEKDKVQYNKQLREFLKKSREESKKPNCYYCGTPCTSFCNSHSVPKFTLRNISIEGHLFYSNTLIDMPLLDNEKGLNEAGTFRLICRECDKTIFSDYENPDNYSEKPTGKMLAQIALKNYLKSISKREMEIALYNNIAEMTGNDLSHQQTINNLDLNEYIDGFNYAKKALEKKWDDYFYLAYYENLNYVVPLAFQNNVTLISDFEGNVINNIYESSPSYRMQDIHICVFPLENHSVILIFLRNQERRYSSFLKQFSRLSTEEKLKSLNYIIFSYSEDVFFYKGIDKTLLNNEELKEVTQQTPIALLTSPLVNPLEKAANTFNLSKRDSIPNFLDEAYKVR